MTFETPSVRRPTSPDTCCLQKVKESKWIDVALITGGIALLVIGILANEDSYLRQTCKLIHEEFTSLQCGTFWKEHGWTETHNTPSYKEAFYQEGRDQNNWRLLSKDLCDRFASL